VYTLFDRVDSPLLIITTASYPYQLTDIYISSELSWKQTEQLIHTSLDSLHLLFFLKTETQKRGTKKKKKFVLACNCIRAKKYLFLLEPLRFFIIHVIDNDFYVTFLLFFFPPFARQEVICWEAICRFFVLAKSSAAAIGVL
jgi:hypothetical protein